MISVKKIAYNNQYNNSFNLIVDAAFDSDNGESDSFLERESVSSETYNGKLKLVNNYKFTNVFSPKFTFIKNDFSDISVAEQRKIFAWLTSKSTPSLLTAYEDDNDTVLFECIGAFTDVRPYKLANNRTVGFIATFESIMPWALSQIQTYTNTTTNENGKTVYTDIEIPIDQYDCDSIIYPTITIKQTGLVVDLGATQPSLDNMLKNTVYLYGGGYYWIDTTGELITSVEDGSGFNTTSVVIINEIDGKAYKTQIINNGGNEVITIDGANKIISSSIAVRTFGDDFNWNWLPLFNRDNTISVIGNCEVTIEFRKPMKIVS